MAMEVPTTWNSCSGTAFIRNVVKELLPCRVEDDDDIFQVGADRSV